MSRRPPSSVIAVACNSSLPERDCREASIQTSDFCNDLKRNINECVTFYLYTPMNLVPLYTSQVVLHYCIYMKVQGGVPYS